jgi:hypothetical protein
MPSILTTRPRGVAVSAHLADSVRASSQLQPLERSFVIVWPMPSQLLARAG